MDKKVKKVTLIILILLPLTIYLYTKSILSLIMSGVTILCFSFVINPLIIKKEILEGKHGEIIYKKIKKRSISDKSKLSLYILMSFAMIIEIILKYIGIIDDLILSRLGWLLLIFIDIGEDFIFTKEIIALNRNIIEVKLIKEVEKIGYTTYLIKSKNRIKVRVEFGKDKEAEECFKSIVNFD